MRITRFIAIPVMGVLLILGACASPATTTPPATTPPATTPPATTPPATTPPATTPPPTTPPPTTPPAPTTPTGPAKFVTSNLRITPLRVEPKDIATVTVTVKNTGGESGTYKVVMKVKGEIKDTKDVTLAGGASQDVTFSVSSETLGDYEVTVDQLSVKLIVEVF